MKQFLRPLLLVAAVMLLYACPPRMDGHSYISLVNKSERDIACQILWKISITEADTLFECRMGAGLISVDSSVIIYSLSLYYWEIDFNSIPYIGSAEKLTILCILVNYS